MAESESPRKRLRVETPPKDTEVSKFAGFNLVKVLNDVPEQKLMSVLGEFPGSDDKAVVVLEKVPFTTETAKIILSDKTAHTVNLENDIYAAYQLFPCQSTNVIKASLVYPASDKHIAKYSAQSFHLVQESPDDYKNITLNHLNTEQFGIQWVYNILDKKTESERIVYEDPDPQNGFILLPDMKWDGKTIESLYLVAIVHKHGIKSLRDLDESHLPLLRNILKKGLNAIQDKYNLPSSLVRAYIHYQPSYYHLHVHFTHLKFQAGGCNVERAHLLSDVIDNIELDSKFYSRKTLAFTLRETDALYTKYKDAGKL